MSIPVTRREFLNLVAASSGTAAVLRVGAAAGLLPAASMAAVPELVQPASRRRKVVVLGAGLSGLSVAYQLNRAGYECTVLEASHRPGGRVFTIRSGTLIDEIGNPQICEWDNDPDLYFNAGAARIPSTHSNTLHYCKELGVSLQIFINENKMAYIQDDNIMGGKPIRNAEFTTSARGFMAELMAKGLEATQLDQPFTDAEAERIVMLLRTFGDLDENNKFTGSSRAGYVKLDYLGHSVQKEMIDFRDLMQANILRGVMSDNEGETGPILMTPVGGMDKIPYAFTRELGSLVKFKAPVRSVTMKDNGVDVVFEQDGQEQLIEADYCFNCIPTHLMSGIKNNFPDDYTRSMKFIRRGVAYKAAFQAKERFWEKEGIYGGITWTNQPIRQIWYPTHGIHSQKGIVLAAYDYGNGMHFTRMSQADRVEALYAQGEKVHPAYRELVEKPVTIGWHRMDHMLGCSARWGFMNDEAEQAYSTLQTPLNGRHYFIGDQISRHSAWMESAFQSAHWALADMDQRVRAEEANA
ncbi:MAG: FAD-dependent oxidoreductase [Pseudomonadales bacterium]|nr:FAD-dependent oxidoreductase [Pseudomonadales bacterium]